MIFSKLKRHNKSNNAKQAPPQNPKILEVNLIKGEAQIVFNWRKNLLMTAIVLIVSAAFTAELYFGLDMWEKSESLKSQALAEETENLGREIKEIQAKADAALNFKAKSGEVSRLIDEHIYWSNFFDWLEKSTLNTVEFADFQGGTDGSYELKATAASFQDVSWQVKVFLDDPLVKRANVSQVSFAEEANINDEKNLETKNRVSFSLSLEVSPEIFKK